METEKIITELNFKAVRSSGAGGQNVNKVSSKVVLTFDLDTVLKKCVKLKICNFKLLTINLQTNELYTRTNL